MKNFVSIPASVVILIISIYMNNYGQENDSRFKKDLVEKEKAELIKA